MSATPQLQTDVSKETANIEHLTNRTCGKTSGGGEACTGHRRRRRRISEHDELMTHLSVCSRLACHCSRGGRRAELRSLGQEASQVADMNEPHVAPPVAPSKAAKLVSSLPLALLHRGRRAPHHGPRRPTLKRQSAWKLLPRFGKSGPADRRGGRRRLTNGRRSQSRPGCCYMQISGL
jgi:hypothetical protein